MKAPTNTEIANIMAANHKEVTDRLRDVEHQVKLTNGRVKDLEVQQIKRDAVAEYLDKRESEDTKSFSWSSLIPWAAGFLIGAVIAGIAIGQSIGVDGG